MTNYMGNVIYLIVYNYNESNAQLVCIKICFSIHICSYKHAQIFLSLLYENTQFEIIEPIYQKCDPIVNARLQITCFIENETTNEIFI